MLVSWYQRVKCRAATRWRRVSLGSLKACVRCNNGRPQTSRRRGTGQSFRPLALLKKPTSQFPVPAALSCRSLTSAQTLPHLVQLRLPCGEQLQACERLANVCLEETSVPSDPVSVWERLLSRIQTVVHNGTRRGY